MMNAELRIALEALPEIGCVDFRIFLGPSPFSGQPVVALTLSIDRDGETPTRAAANLGRALPPWHQSPAEADGPLDGHGVLARVAGWCTTMLRDAGGSTTDAGVLPAGEPGTAATLWVGYDNAGATQLVIAEALALLATPASPDDPDLSSRSRERARRLLRTLERSMPGPQARILTAAARARSIPIVPMFDPAMRQFGWGARGALFWETTSNGDGVAGHVLSRNKAAMKHMIDRLGLPTPPAQLLAASASYHQALELLGWPLVVKPLDRGGGQGVTADIRTIDQLEAAIARARTLTSLPVLVERHVTGTDYRLLVVDGRMVAAIRRTPASVTGDGTRTIEMLVADLNAVRSADLQSRLYLKQIALDAILLEQLAARGLGLASIPEAGETVRLRSNANRSTGAACLDVTSGVHPEVAAAAIEICENAGLRCAGIDYLTDDITAPPARGNGGFIEVNTTPGTATLAAAGMDAVAIAGLILGDVGRVPSTLILAPRDAQAALAERLRRAPGDRGISWLCGGAARIDGRDVAVSGRSLRDQVAMLLTARRTREVTIVCDVDQVTGDGLPLDRFGLSILCEPLPAAWQAVIERHSVRSVRATVDQIGWT